MYVCAALLPLKSTSLTLPTTEYRERIAEHFLKLQKAQEALKRNEAKAAVHAEEKKLIKSLTSKMTRRQVKLLKYL